MSVSFFPCFMCAYFCRHPLSQLLLVSLMLLTFCCWHPCFCFVNARVRRIPMIPMIHFKSNRSKYGSYLLDICTTVCVIFAGPIYYVYSLKFATGNLLQLAHSYVSPKTYPLSKRIFNL
jgi:hypothetical protein